MWSRCSRGDGLKRFHHERCPQEKPWLRSVLRSPEPGLAAGSCIWRRPPAFCGFFPVFCCSPAAAVAFQGRNKPAPLAVSHPSPAPGTPAFPGEWDVFLDVIMSINRLFRSPSSFTNVILSADASPCFSAVGFSQATAQQRVGKCSCSHSKISIFE